MMPLYHSTNLPLGWQLQAIFWPLRGKAGGSSQLARETVFSSFISHLLYNLVIWPICNSTFTIILVPIPYSQTENKETPSNVGCTSLVCLNHSQLFFWNIWILWFHSFSLLRLSFSALYRKLRCGLAYWLQKVLSRREMKLFKVHLMCVVFSLACAWMTWKVLYPTWDQLPRCRIVAVTTSQSKSSPPDSPEAQSKPSWITWTKLRSMQDWRVQTILRWGEHY